MILKMVVGVLMDTMNLRMIWTVKSVLLDVKLVIIWVNVLLA